MMTLMTHKSFNSIAILFDSLHALDRLYTSMKFALIFVESEDFHTVLNAISWEGFSTGVRNDLAGTLERL